MKPIVLDEEAEQKILKKFAEAFQKQWENFKQNMNDTKFEFSVNLADKAKEKIVILYTPQAYLRMRSLVDYFDTEVGWYGLVDRLDKKTFRVYDVLVCKQYVDGSKVDTEDKDTLDFFNSLTDDEAEHMHFQAHSHVRMGTGASGPDLRNQADVIKNIGKTGFYIFQIWNKNDDINTYLYDLDNNVFYDRNDITLQIEDELGTMDDFLAQADALVEEKKVYNMYAKQYKYTNPPQFEAPGKRETYLNGYWDGVDYNGYGGW